MRSGNEEKSYRRREDGYPIAILDGTSTRGAPASRGHGSGAQAMSKRSDESSPRYCRRRTGRIDCLVVVSCEPRRRPPARQGRPYLGLERASSIRSFALRPGCREPGTRDHGGTVQPSSFLQKPAGFSVMARRYWMRLRAPQAQPRRRALRRPRNKALFADPRGSGFVSPFPTSSLLLLLLLLPPRGKCRRNGMMFIPDSLSSRPGEISPVSSLTRLRCRPVHGPDGCECLGRPLSIAPTFLRGLPSRATPIQFFFQVHSPGGSA